MRVRGTNVKVSEVAEEVWTYGQLLATYNPDDIADDDGEATGDIRLQVADGAWQVHTGDASYDTDHNGHWGASSVSAGCSKREARDIARYLITEAADCAAQSAE